MPAVASRITPIQPQTPIAPVKAPITRSAPKTTRAIRSHDAKLRSIPILQPSLRSKALERPSIQTNNIAVSLGPWSILSIDQDQGLGDWDCPLRAQRTPARGALAVHRFPALRVERTSDARWYLETPDGQAFFPNNPSDGKY